MLVPKLHLSPSPLVENQGQAFTPAVSVPVSPAGPTKILSMQPEPLSTRRTRFRDSGGQWITNISRVFRPEDVARCRLCQQCAACPRTGQCLVSFFEFVPDDQLKYKRKETL
jgi:hypothetical protein